MGEYFGYPEKFNKTKEEISSKLTEILGEKSVCHVLSWNDGMVMEFIVYNTNAETYSYGSFILDFRLTIIPNSNIMVSYSMSINPKYQGKGIAQALQKIKEDLCKSLGFKGMLCTVNKDNAVQIHILEKFGWTKIHSITESELMYYKGV